MSFSEAEIDAALAALSRPGRLDAAQQLVGRAAPTLERVLGSALHEGGWFDAAHQAAVSDAAGNPDPQERVRAVRTLFAEETRLTMLVGVAVGFELARELEATVTATRVEPEAETAAEPEAGTRRATDQEE